MLLPLLSPPAPPSGPPLIVYVNGSDVALADSQPEPPGAGLFVGTIGDVHCWAVDATGATDPPADPGVGPFQSLMRVHGTVDEATWLAAGRAVQLVAWDRNHRYCGSCAAPTTVAASERARVCPECGLQAFPRLAPAIITLVERSDGRALLARNGRWPTPMYSCLAGFVEPGESVEAAVSREVAEEVGIRTGELSYYGSQPWPFPHSLMLGFHAAYAGGEITVDGVEISDARWFAPDDLPEIPGPVSIARRLIDDWVARTV